MKIMTNRDEIRQEISTYDAIKSIKKLISLTQNDASSTIFDVDINSKDAFMSCHEMLFSATSAHEGKTNGIKIGAIHDVLHNQKVLEWAGTWTKNRRIQWNFLENNEVRIFISSGTGEKSTFISSVFDGTKVISWGGMSNRWLIPMEDT